MFLISRFLMVKVPEAQIFVDDEACRGNFDC